MKDRTECEVFQDRLDAVRAGTAGPEDRDRLREHAASCPDCAALLRMHERLDLPAQDELEAAVPSDLVDSMWPRVREVVGVGPAAGAKGASRWTVRPPAWLVPAMAAAIAALLLGVGYLAGDRARLREREADLAQRVAEQGRRLTELERSGPGGAFRTGGPLTSAGWERALTGRETITLGEMRTLLARVPAGTTLFGASELEALSGAIPFWLRDRWSAALDGIDVSDGVQAGEMLAALRALDLDAGTSIPTARILAIYRAAFSTGRS